MRILWLCSIMLPRIAESLKLNYSMKEGWLTGLSDMIVERSENNEINFGVCFPVSKNEELIQGEIDGISYYSFHENTSKPWKYEEEMEVEIKRILDAFQPDLIHIFGTEYPHGLAIIRASEDIKTLVSIQGLCYAYAKVYSEGIPIHIQKRFTLRDFIKWDNIDLQKRKFEKRGVFEIELLHKMTNVSGRTEFDYSEVKKINPKIKYHFMNETLRNVFYDNKWVYDKCQPYRIFMSQGNYPIKGLHYMLEALPKLKLIYPNVHLCVAGDVITNNKLLKEKLKLSSYGKYLNQLIREHNLTENITFVGKLNEHEMCSEYLKSNVFVSTSNLENSPNSVGEAMILGMPVVSSNVGGVRNLLEDNIEGYLYNLGDKDALVDCICKVFDKKENIREIGCNARAHAIATHDRSVNYNRLIDIYKTIINCDY